MFQKEGPILIIRNISHINFQLDGLKSKWPVNVGIVTCVSNLLRTRHKISTKTLPLVEKIHEDVKARKAREGNLDTLIKDRSLNPHFYHTQ